MKLKLFIYLLILSVGVQAQSYLIIHKKDSATIGLPTSEIDSITHFGQDTTRYYRKNSPTLNLGVNTIDRVTRAVPVTGNLYDSIKAYEYYKKFTAEIDTAGFNPYPLGLSGNITVFAPDDLIVETLFGINMSEADVRYHILSEKILTTDLNPETKNLRKNTISTNNLPQQDSVFITRLKNVTFSGTPIITVNGVPIDNTRRNINTSNGVLHELRLISPIIPAAPGQQLPRVGVYGYLFPTINRTIYDEITGTGYDSLKKVIQIAEKVDPNIKTLLQSGRVTLLAPSDSAFIDYLELFNYSSIDDWYAQKDFSLLEVVKDHILIDRQFLFDIVDATQIVNDGVISYGGTKVGTAQINNPFKYGFELKGNPASQFAPLINNSSFDFTFKNGVVHYIRKIMIRQ
jgi:hypothetical protein